ncbi:hypothetical protein, partial [Gluconacetobacter sp.]|uniref:hypothetical protein n=1 Tax=Gluconacetobacter sp. TaxID=1935994 RepID=UPI0039E8CFDD
QHIYITNNTKKHRYIFAKISPYFTIFLLQIRVYFLYHAHTRLMTGEQKVSFAHPMREYGINAGFTLF